jgi:predicted MFS family arabinose efflux permease
LAFRRLPFLILALLGVDFLDEFASGMPTVGAPGIQATFELSYSTIAFVVFTAPLAASFVLEPPLFVLADRYPKKYFVCGGLLAMGVLDVIIGLSGTFWVVAAALFFATTANGCGVSLSQATLMDAYPAEREKMMVRWTFMGSAGDLVAPALFWLLASFALGWREAFLVSGAIVVLYALMLARQTFPEPVADAQNLPEDAEEPSFREITLAALRNRRLLVWLLGVWLCGLLDELLVAFGALYLRDALSADAASRSVVLMAFMVGGMLGLLLLHRLLGRVGSLPLLRLAALGSAASYVAWLSASTIVASAAWMAAVGFFTSALYPIAKAQAYRALPGRSGMVNAVSHVFTPLDVVLPLGLGLVADAFGLLPALAILIAQPVLLFAIATLVSKRPAEAGADTP